jgi:ADP-ribose pyrophosphatase
MSDPGTPSQSQEVFHGDLLTVRVETITSPSGEQRYEIVEHPDAVAIVALRADPAGGAPQVALVRQSRPALGRETWELPAGLVRTEESKEPQRAAERELREETGCVAQTWRLLTHEYSSPGFSTEAITIFLATDLTVDTSTSRDPEILAVEWLPFSQALERVRSGRIEDGKTLLGLTFAASLIGGAMPADATNMPFPRQERGGDEPSRPLDGALNLETMLMEEFSYASVTAYQAMEDRARMFNLYLLLIGVLASGLGALFQLGGGFQAFTPWLTLGLISLAGMLGIVFFLKLIRLRQAHRDSLVTMNMIKAHYIQVFSTQYENLKELFHWRLDTIPGGERFGSVTFLVCFAVAFLDSLCLGAAAFFAYAIFAIPGGLNALKLENTGMPLEVALAAGAVAALAQVFYYLYVFGKRREKEKLRRYEMSVAQVRRIAGV